MKRKTPKLRFPEFEDDWKTVLFEDVFTEETERTSDIEKYPLYSLTVEDGVTPKSERYERSFLLKKEDDNYKIVNTNSFVYNPMNLTIGSVAKHKEEKIVSVSGYYNVFHTKQGYDSDFMEMYLKSHRMISLYKAIATGSLIEKQRVHYSQFIKLKQPVPTLDEQKKIGDFFSLLDQKIKKQKEKIEQLELFKKGMMQKIFSREIRFKNEKGQDYPVWRKYEFGDIATHKCPKVDPQKLEKSVPCVELENMSTNTGKINRYFDSSTQQSTKNQFVKGSVLFGKLRPYLKKYWYSSFDGICSSEIWVLQPTSKKLSARFLYYLVQTEHFQRAVNISSGSKMPRADWEVVSQLVIHLPSTDEQQKITDLLTSIDEKIEKEQEKTEALSQMKKGFLQQMFI